MARQQTVATSYAATGDKLNRSGTEDESLVYLYLNAVVLCRVEMDAKKCNQVFGKKCLFNILYTTHHKSWFMG